MAELRKEPIAGHKFAPISKAPAYLKVCETIEADILSGSLVEGDLLPTEIELCAQLGVTRSTVREGIRLLETSGLVVRGAAKRLVIRRPGSGDVARSTSRALTFSGVTFREAWDVLALFQPQVAAMACVKFDRDDIEILKDIHAALEMTSSSEFDKIVGYTDAFFAAMAAGFNNSITTALLQSLNQLIEAGLRQVITIVPDARQRILKAQSELITAIEQKDEARARQWMSRHIDDLQRGYAIAGIDMDALIA